MQNKAKNIAQALVSVLEKADEKEAKEKAQRFKQVAFRWGAIKQISEILREFEKAWKKRDGEIATVVSASPLSQDLKEKIERSLRDKKYTLKEKTDPSVIGGMALFLGNNYLIDATFKGKLKRMLKTISS